MNLAVRSHNWEYLDENSTLRKLDNVTLRGLMKLFPLAVIEVKLGRPITRNNISFGTLHPY